MFAQGPFLIEIIFNGNPIVLFYNLSRRQSLRRRARQKKNIFLVQVLLFEHFCGILFLLSNPHQTKMSQVTFLVASRFFKNCKVSVLVNNVIMEMLSLVALVTWTVFLAKSLA